MTDRTTAHPASGRAWAAVGLVAALTGLAAGHLIAALTAPRAAPLSAVSDLIIAIAPPQLTDWAIDTFGTADKPLLQAGIIAALAALGAAAGLAWRRRRWTGAALVAALTLAGAAAAGALHWWASRGRTVTVTGRRAFLAVAAGIGLAALAGAFIARRIGPGSVEADRAALDLPEPDIDALDPGPAADLDVPGLEPWHTPNDDFYRIDTAITAPTVEVDTWRLRVRGRVGREHTYTLDDLLGRELIERDITLCCVSNPIGGELIGNARWLGVSLADLLAESDPDPDADQLVSRSVDGWTAGSPTAAVFDGRDALIAIGMNGQPLPLDHGWPARLIIPGLYGYVSATKWVTELELTRFDAYDPYWIERGWAGPGPIKTASRIDTPRGGAEAGTVTVAGVAWAQPRGISAVHLKIDDGDWTECELSDVAAGDTWRQWRTDWAATGGQHTLTVRATDGDGVPQTEAVTGVKPDGATGLHKVTIDVE